MSSLSVSRLPDLPNAGFSTWKQQLTSDMITFFMRGVERNRLLLLSIVIDGIDKWRKTAGKEWKGLLIDRDLLDSIFRYFVLQAGPNPAQQLLILHGQQELAQRTQFDRRTKTRVQIQKAQRQALADLARAQGKRTH